MKHYYVNKNAQSTGEYEVHEESCNYLPSSDNRKYLGYFSSCHEAIKKAKEDFYDVDGCYYCCNECHTR